MTELNRLPDKPSRASGRWWTAIALSIGAAQGVLAFTHGMDNWLVLVPINALVLSVVLVSKMHTSKDVQTLADTIARIAEARR